MADKADQPAEPVRLLKTEVYDIVDEVEPLYTARTAEKVRNLRQAAAMPCRRASLLRLGFTQECTHCRAVRELRLIDGSLRSEEGPR